MNITEGFLLGLSTGVVCLAYCGPVLIPFLMGEANTLRNNSMTVALFLAGRLVAYSLVGLISGFAGSRWMQPSQGQTFFFGVVYIMLALLMVAYGFYRFNEICLGKTRIAGKEYFKRWPWLVPVAGGFATGINLCPPFLLAITGALQSGAVLNSFLYFVFFFLGTSLYFVPLPFIGFFRRQQVLRIVGKFAAILAGIIYLYKGIIILVSI
jgi:sulfite exporter TauE/SafE